MYVANVARFHRLLSPGLSPRRPWLCACVRAPLPPFAARGWILAPFRGGGSTAARQHAPLARMHSKRAPSAAHHALPVSGQSSVVHVPLCRCVSCALCENLRAPNRTPHPSRCAMPAVRCLHLSLCIIRFLSVGSSRCVLKPWRTPPLGKRQRRWLAALLPPPSVYLDLRVLQAIARVALPLCLVPRLVNVSTWHLALDPSSVLYLQHKLCSYLDAL
jgi:hypothetical protein